MILGRLEWMARGLLGASVCVLVTAVIHLVSSGVV